MPLCIIVCTRTQTLDTWCTAAAAKSQEDGRSRGFAHVQFDSVEGAAKAIALNGSDLLGRDLFIDSAQERSGGAAGGGGRGSYGAPAGGRGGGRGGEPSPVTVASEMHLLL